MRNQSVVDRSSDLRVILLLAVTFVLLAFAAPEASAQQPGTGELRGRVTDASNSEVLIRAVIRVMDTKSGTYSDLKGVYTLRKMPRGACRISVSMIGYATREIADVVIGDGVTTLDVALEPATTEGTTVTVRDRASRGTEATLMNERRKAPNMRNEISAAQIRRSPDATSGDALARVPGLGLTASRFVSVRGTNERYNNAQLNGVSLMSTEPDKKAFSFDLFPANLLENTIVSKTFTPDLPGDFTGGLVQLTTTDFPDRPTLRLAISGSYADGTTFEPVLLGNRGATDYLGYDDGARALPSSIPDSGIGRTSVSQKELAAYSKEFSNSWKRAPVNAPPNGTFLLSYGDRFDLMENDLGVVAALSYRSGFSFTPLVRRDTSRFDYTGERSSYSTLWGGIFNLSYKLSDLHTISVKNVYTRTAEDTYTYLEGFDSYTSQGKQRHAFQYLERGFYSGQVTGEHVIPEIAGIRAQWRGYTSLGQRNEPDHRRMTYIRPDNDTSLPFMAAIGQAPSSYTAGRFYSSLDEDIFGAALDITIPVETIRVKVGGVVENRNRDFRARQFGYYAGGQKWQFPVAALDTIFDPSHFAEDGLLIAELSEPSDRYNAHGHLNAAYAMADLPFTLFDQSFRLVAGVRMEDSRQRVNTADRSLYKPVEVNYNTIDYLPSINFVYQVSPSFNLRAAYSNTVMRPEIREFASFTFYDFTTDQLVYGNPDIRRAISRNYDLRAEIFPGTGEIFAISLFHKNITDAIEAVGIAGVNERTWANADRALNTGVELEARKTLGFLGDWLAPFSVSVNYTWLDSKVDISRTGLSEGVRDRRLQGQAPYIVNAGIYFDDLDLGTSITLLYNRSGERITELRGGDRNVPDFIEQPRDVIDLSISQSLFERYEMKLSVRDMLAQDIASLQGDVPSRVDGKQAGVTLGVTLKF